MKPVHMLGALFVMALWGTNFAVSRYTLGEFSPMLLMALRYLAVAILLLPFVKVPRGQMRQIFFYSIVLGGVHFPLMLHGMLGAEASTASIVIQLQVPFASLMAAYFFKDALGWRRGVGMGIAFMGVALIASRGGGGDSDPLHLGLIVLAAAAFAFSNIQVKWMGAVDAFQLNAYMALFAVPQLAFYSLLLEDGQMQQVMNASWGGWLGFAYMVVMSTIVAYAIWQPMVKRYDVNQTIPFLMLVPVFGVASGVLWLGEVMSWALIVGGGLVITGVGIILIRRPKIVVARNTV
ncbi:DMT family transporter [Niveispirillum fermenti]|uniref:DMT family transporter n=1 Tax=Niveispirillum fermenti TaxID=1233113 RepID=UPI003A885338